MQIKYYIFPSSLGKTTILLFLSSGDTDKDSGKWSHCSTKQEGILKTTHVNEIDKTFSHLVSFNWKE